MISARVIRLLTAGALCLGPLPALAATPIHVNYVLDWLPTGYIGFAEIAVKEGYFAKQGLDVKIDIGRGGSDAITRVAAGSDDFGSANLGALMNAAAGATVPVKAVASVYTMAPDAIVTLQGSGITSIKDLTGKTISTATYSGSNALWPVIAKLNGVDPDSVKLLKVDDSTLGPMLAAGKVDAVIAWVMNEPEYSALVPAGKKLVILPWSNYGLTGYNWSLLASDKMIKTHPDVVKKFVTAYLQAVQFMIANPEQAGEDVHELAPDTDTATNVAGIKQTIPLLKNAITDKYGFGTFQPSLVQASWKWVAQSQGLALSTINPMDTVDTSFVTSP
jgi:NitT/TauT family transport system substrate-binding protein